MEDILSVLPHRQPMLQLDRILQLTEQGCIGVKNISHSEPCFAGHFPGKPIFPGVLTIEALAQTCSYWLCRQDPDKLPIFAEIRAARFLNPVLPGDQLRLEAVFKGEEKGFCTFEANAYVEERQVCRATLIIAHR